MYNGASRLHDRYLKTHFEEYNTTTDSEKEKIDKKYDHKFIDYSKCYEESGKWKEESDESKEEQDH